LNASYSKKTGSIISIFGILFMILVWYFAVEYFDVPRRKLPNPYDIFHSLFSLIFSASFWKDVSYSIKLNFFGYVQSITLSIVLGFVIGLFAPLRSFFSPYIYASRYIPLSAIIPLMIAWFGSDDNMKIQFLSLGIMVFLLPAVIQRVNETSVVYLQTAKTLGATKWQMIKTIFIPDVISRVMPDIKIMTAISWTYIIMAEMVNKVGGIGSLMWTFNRKAQYENMYASLLVLIAIGILWDLTITVLDMVIFRHKYYTHTIGKS
jgi:NitT/TauT family transport system permease protein